MGEIFLVYLWPRNSSFVFVALWILLQGYFCKKQYFLCLEWNGDGTPLLEVCSSKPSALHTLETETDLIGAMPLMLIWFFYLVGGSHPLVSAPIASKYCRKRPFARNSRRENDIFAISFTMPFTIAGEVIRSA